MQHYDVAIVGGGLVGASLAHALADSGLKIIIFDKQPAAQLYQPEQDNRGLALSYLSAELLTAWGVWPKIAAHASAITAVHVSTKGRFGFSKFTAARFNLPALGYVVAASILGQALTSDLAHVTVKRPVILENLRYVAGSGWILDAAQEQFSATLVVGADGSDSLVRKCVGIENDCYAYAETAIISNIDTQVNTSTAFERFTEAGILAMLPFGAKRVKCVLTLPNEQAAGVAQATDQVFLARIQNLFGDRLGRLQAASQRMLFPIQQVRAQQISAPGLILLGNAAHTLHPVAAQGFNLALRDIMVLAKLLNNNTQIDSVTEKYAALRAQDQERTHNFTHLLAALPNSIKHATLCATQFLPPLNDMLARRGLGTWI